MLLNAWVRHENKSEMIPAPVINLNKLTVFLYQMKILGRLIVHVKSLSHNSELRSLNVKIYIC